MEPGPPGRPWAASSHLPFLSFSHCFQHLNRSSGCWSSLRHAHSASHQDTGRDGDGERTRRNRGCTQQEVKKCPFPDEMKELSLELSAPKGAGALSAGVSQKSHLHQNALLDMLQFYFSPFISVPLPPHLAAPLSSQHQERAERAASGKGTGEKEKSWKLREKPESLLVPLQREL